MIWLASFVAGGALGLAYFGGLRLTVDLIVGRPRWAALAAISSLGRLALLGLALAVLEHRVPGSLLAAVVGIIAGRWVCLFVAKERSCGA